MQFVNRLLVLVGAVFVIAGFFVGTPVAVAVLATHFAVAWSWVTVQALVGLAVGGFLVHHFRDAWGD